MGGPGRYSSGSHTCDSLGERGSTSVAREKEVSHENILIYPVPGRTMCNNEFASLRLAQLERTH